MKRGKGCLVVIGAMSLINLILIIFITVIFPAGGQAVFDLLSKSISPPISFTNKISLDRHSGWIVKKQKENSYVLVNPLNKKIKGALLFLFPSQQGVSDKLIIENIVGQMKNAAETEYKHYSYIETKKIRIGSHEWTEYILKHSSKDKYWTILYKNFDNNLLIAQYLYKLDADKPEQEIIKIAADEKSIHQSLNSITFQ